MNEMRPNLKNTFVITLGEQNIELPGHTEQNKLMIHKRFHRWKESKIDDVEFYLAKDTRLYSNEQAAQNYGFSVDISPPYNGHFTNEQGAVGCFVSHWEIWKKISKMKNLKTTDYFIILEDDVYIDNVKHVHKNFEELAVDMFKNSKLIASKDQKVRIAALHYQREHGSEAYLVNQAGAKLLISNIKNMTISMPVDKYIWHFSRNKRPNCFYDYPCIWVDRDLWTSLYSHPDHAAKLHSQSMEEKHKFIQKIQKTLELKKYKNGCSLKELMDKGLLNLKTLDTLNEFIYRPPKHYIDAFYDKNGEIFLCAKGTAPADKEKAMYVS